MKKYMRIMTRSMKLKCLGVIAIAFIGSYTASVWPVKLGVLYTDISSGRICNLSQGIKAILIFGGFFLIAELISIIRRVIMDCIIASNEADVRDMSIDRLLKVPVSYYSETLSGEKTAQLNQGVAGFSQLIKISCNDIAATVLTAVCTFVQVITNAPGAIVAIMTVYLFVAVLVSVLQIRSQNGIREDIITQKNHLDGVICQMISNLEYIRVRNSESAERKRLSPLLRRICRTEQRHHMYMGGFDCLKHTLKCLFQLIILTVSLIQIAGHKMTPGTVITVCLLFQQLTKPLDDVYRFMDETASSFIKSKALINLAEEQLDEIYSIQSSEEKCTGSEILIKDVVISDPGRKTELASYETIRIPAGKIVALRGVNGCGKSTLIRGMTRFYPLTHGVIELFGKPLTSFSQQELSETVYYSPQKSYFVAGTVRENLTYGLTRDVDDEELAEALLKVRLVGSDHKETVIDPDPYKALDTYISEKADELSGGMKQRLSLARAFLKSPKLFVFDEITANLDAASTDYVLKAMREYARELGATIVYISHDRKVVEACDLIIDIENLLHSVNGRLPYKFAA